MSCCHIQELWTLLCCPADPQCWASLRAGCEGWRSCRIPAFLATSCLFLKEKQVNSEYKQLSVERDRRWYGTYHFVSVKRAVPKAVYVPEAGMDYRWLRCCMQLFFNLCCDNAKGRAAWWIDCWAGTCELSVESAFIRTFFSPLLPISEEEIVSSAQWNTLRPTALRTCYQYHQGENVCQAAIKCFFKVLPHHIHLSSSCRDLPPSHSMKGMEDPAPGTWMGLTCGFF